MTGNRTLKLTVELVPTPLWGRSLNRLLKDSVWQQLRRQTLNDGADRCAACGSEQRPLHVHEAWRYDDQLHVQQLTGLRPLCVTCSTATHWGRATIIAAEGKVDMKELLEHFCRVNGVSARDANRHIDAAYADWERRSRHQQWTQNFGPFRELTQAPENLRGGPRRSRQTR